MGLGADRGRRIRSGQDSCGDTGVWLHAATHSGPEELWSETSQVKSDCRTVPSGQDSMKQRWGVKERFVEVKARVLTGGRTLRERLEIIRSGLRFLLVTAAHAIVVALENIHESFLGTLFFFSSSRFW